MNIATFAAPPFFENAYLVSCDETGDAVVIDPGDAVEELIAHAAKARVRVTAILLTHAHLDHVSGVARAKRAFDVPVWLHRDDLFLYNGVVEQGRMFGLSLEQPPPADHFYGPNERLTFGKYVVDVRHTPGHCPGGVCLAIGRAGAPGDQRELFVGDTLFEGSIGRVDLPGGDLDVLLTSIRQQLLVFPDTTIVHSGHGPDTTVGGEKAMNPFLTH
jgi:glyoxylase-like metal-dependent hydrolase (beta-lactamase superfamily II)